MKIQSVEVKGWTRYNLNPDMRYFKYTPSSKLCVVLGDNGSGKSSLLRLMLPWPIDTSTLQEGGFIEILLSLKGQDYKLRTDTNAPHYSFFNLSTGEELNEGGKITIQRELVTTLLGIDKDLTQLLTDEVRFTAMSPIDRRKWIERISETDYTFVTKVHQKATKGLNNRKAVLNSVKQKLSNIIIDKNASIQGEKMERLKNEVESLLMQYDFTSHSVAKQEVEAVMESLERRQMTYERSLKALLQSRSASSWDIDGGDTEVELALCAREIETLVGEQSEVALELSTVCIDDDIIDVVGIPSRNECEGRIRELGESDHPYPINDKVDYSLLASTLSSLLPTISEWTSTLSASSTSHQEEARELTTSLETLSQKRVTIQDSMDRTSARITELLHLKDHTKTTCPNCQHVYYTQYNQEDHDVAISDLEQLRRAIEKLDSLLDTMRVKCEDMHAQAASIDRITELIEGSPVTTYLGKYLRSSGILEKHPYKLIALLHKEKEKADSAIRHIAHREESNTIHRYIAAHDERERIQSDELQDKRARLTHRSTTIKRSLQEKRRRHSQITKLGVAVRGHDKALMAFNEELATAEQLFIDYKETRKRKALSERISTVKSELMQLEYVAEKYRVLKSTQSTLEAERISLEEAVSVHQTLVASLCPKKGMLALSIVGFVGGVVDAMNDFIQRIWEYDLEITPPDPSKGLDLTYRLALVVDGTARKDVSNGSKSIKGIVDLAFKMTVMRQLGMSEYPLLIDEMGSGYDIKHVEKLATAILSIAEGSTYSNLFVVSQHAQIYSLFGYNACEYVCIRNENTNTSVLQEYNTNLELLS